MYFRLSWTLLCCARTTARARVNFQFTFHMTIIYFLYASHTLHLLFSYPCYVLPILAHTLFIQHALYGNLPWLSAPHWTYKYMHKFLCKALLLGEFYIFKLHIYMCKIICCSIEQIGMCFKFNWNIASHWT